MIHYDTAKPWKVDGNQFCFRIISTESGSLELTQWHRVWDEKYNLSERNSSKTSRYSWKLNCLLLTLNLWRMWTRQLRLPLHFWQSKERSPSMGLHSINDHFYDYVQTVQISRLSVGSVFCNAQSSPSLIWNCVIPSYFTLCSFYVDTQMVKLMILKLQDHALSRYEHRTNNSSRSLFLSVWKTIVQVS